MNSNKKKTSSYRYVITGHNGAAIKLHTLLLHKYYLRDLTYRATRRLLNKRVKRCK